MAFRVKPLSIRLIEPVGSQVYSVVMERLHPACLPDIYTVSLRAFGWNGSCTCGAFTGCCEYLLKHDPANRHRCDHIHAARQFFMEHEMPRLMAEFEHSKIIVLPPYENIPASG